MIKSWPICPACWVIALLLIVTSFTVSGDNWTQYGHDDLNTGLSSSKVPQNLDVIWSNSVDGEPLSIIADYDTVYVGLREYITDVGPYPDLEPTYEGVAAVYAFDLEDGSKKWMTEFEDDVRGLAINGNKLIVSSFGHLTALNKNNGKFIWDTEIGTDMFPPAISGNKVFVCSYNRYVYAVDIEDGDVIWSYYTGGNFLSSPVIFNKKVIVGCMNNKVYGLNEENGSKVWEFQTGDDVACTPAINDGIVYIGSNDHNLYALDTENGDLISVYESEGNVYTPAIGYGKIYFWTKTSVPNPESPGNVFIQSTLIAIDINTFSKVWEFLVERDWIRHQPTLADGEVITASEDRFYIIDAETGAEIVNKDLYGQIQTTPIIAEEKIIVGIDKQTKHSVVVLGEDLTKEIIKATIILLIVLIVVLFVIVIIMVILKRKKPPIQKTKITEHDVIGDDIMIVEPIEEEQTFKNSPP